MDQTSSPRVEVDDALILMYVFCSMISLVMESVFFISQQQYTWSLVGLPLVLVQKLEGSMSLYILTDRWIFYLYWLCSVFLLPI